jgi:hypothetical protein
VRVKKSKGRPKARAKSAELKSAEARKREYTKGEEIAR